MPKVVFLLIIQLELLQLFLLYGDLMRFDNSFFERLLDSGLLSRFLLCDIHDGTQIFIDLFFIFSVLFV